VSKVTKRHCAGTVQSQGGRVWNVKQVGFESRPEDSYGRCRRDMIRETVPGTSSGDRKSSEWVEYSPKYSVDYPTCLCQKRRVWSVFGLSSKDTQDKNAWKLRIEGAHWFMRITGYQQIKKKKVCNWLTYLYLN